MLLNLATGGILPSIGSVAPFDLSGKALDPNDGPFMQAACNQLGAIPSLNLESNLCAFNMDDASGTGDCPSKGRSRQMAQFNLNSYAAFISFQKGLQRLPGRALQESDEIGCAWNPAHKWGTGALPKIGNP